MYKSLMDDLQLIVTCQNQMSIKPWTCLIIIIIICNFSMEQISNTYYCHHTQQQKNNDVSCRTKHPLVTNVYSWNRIYSNPGYRLKKIIRSFGRAILYLAYLLSNHMHAFFWSCLLFLQLWTIVQSIKISIVEISLNV